MAEDSTTYTYTCGDKTGFEYYVLGDDIRNEFDFLKSSNVSDTSIVGNLDKMMKYIKNASSNTAAFLFKNNAGLTESDLNKLEQEISQYVNELKGNLDVLHGAIMTDIDNVNAELDLNFGYWQGRHLARQESEKK